MILSFEVYETTGIGRGPVGLEPLFQVIDRVGGGNRMGLTSNTVIETDMGFETVAEACDRIGQDEVGGTLVQTRKALQAAEKITSLGVKKVYQLKFRTEDGTQHYTICCTGNTCFDTAIQGDAAPDWQQADHIGIGQEVWAVDPEKYNKAKLVAGRQNIEEQHYYAHLTTLELEERTETTPEECYTLVNVENKELIANGLIVHEAPE